MNDPTSILSRFGVGIPDVVAELASENETRPLCFQDLPFERLPPILYQYPEQLITFLVSRVLLDDESELRQARVIENVPCASDDAA